MTGRRVAVITGASSGLGAGMAARLAEHGFAVGLCARREPAAPDGAEALTRSVDVTDAAAVDVFANEVDEHLGPIDLWVNNAGVLGPMEPARDSPPDEVARALLVNIGGVMYGSAAFARLARTWAPGRRLLVNISSGAATSVYEGWSTYGPTKAAVDHFTRILAAEEPELLVHAVAPGVVDTAMQELIREADEHAFPAIDRFRELHRTGAWNSPSWVADHLVRILDGDLAPDDVVYRVPDEPRD